MRTSLDVTHHVSKDWLPFILAKDLAFLFLVHFGKNCTSFSLNGVLNIRTGNISPQYYVAFDDIFSTLYHIKKVAVPLNWKNMV